MAPPAPTFPPGYAEESLGPRVVAVSVTFIVLEVAVVAARFAARIIYRSSWGVDDYLIIPALLFALGMCIISIIEVDIAGVGRHLDYLYVTNPQAVVNWAKCGYAIEQIYCAAVAFPKLSILASYLRIFTTKPYRYTTYAVASIVTAAMVAGIITSLASCSPFDARWNPKLFVTNCIDAVRYWQGMSIPNIITDVIMLFLPMPVVWHLHVSTNQKLALSVVFALGSFGIIASCIRLAVTFHMHNLEDGTYDSADIATWSTVESGCYLIAACLPVLRPFFFSFGKRVATIAKSSGAASNNANSAYHSNGYAHDNSSRGKRFGIPLESFRSDKKDKMDSQSDENFIIDGRYSRLDA